jgi:hypothetical protein
MVYLLDVTKNCDDTFPMKPSGNALDPASFKLTCQCGEEAEIFSVREVGLHPSNPDFQARVDAALADFTSLSYYVVTVEDGLMTAEPRWRTEVRIEFHTVAECKTCRKAIGDPKCSQQELKDFMAAHKGHNLSTGTALNTNDPRIIRMVKQMLIQQGKKS